MPIVNIKGRRYFQHEGKNYVPGSKPFEKLVNAERREGKRLFEEPLRIGGRLYVINPVLKGKGSGSALVELNTTGLGVLTQAGQKKLTALNTQWLKGETRYSINPATGDVDRFVLGDKPLLLKEFASGRAKGNEIAFDGEVVYEGGIPLNKRVSGTLETKIVVKWVSSGKVWNGLLFTAFANKKLENVNAIVLETLGQEYPAIAGDVDNNSARVESLTHAFKNRQGKTFDLADMKLREVGALDITSIYGESVELIQTDKNCVREYVERVYHKDGKGIGKKAIDKLGDKDGVSANELAVFCERYKIKMVLFDINGNVVKAHYPSENKKWKPLVAIVYNNHIYPLKNKELNKVKKRDTKEYIYSPDIDCDLLGYLRKGIHPTNIRLDGDRILDFRVDDKVYHTNQELPMVQGILEKFGVKDKEEPHFHNINNIDRVLERLYIKTSTESYFPYPSNEAGFNYFNEELKGDFTTIDHNKHYAEALRNLPYLITCDIRTAKHVSNPPDLMEGKWLYIATPIKSNILMPKTGFYDGWFLQYCKDEGIKFKLHEAISCQYVENAFTPMINDMYEKLSAEEFKDIYVRMIGKFEAKPKIRHNTKFIKIANDDELKASEGLVHTLNVKTAEGMKNYHVVYDMVENQHIDIYNRVPIRIQTLCNARKMVYEKMKQMKLRSCDIKQIKTDAITFVNNQVGLRLGSGMGEWKRVDEIKYFTKANTVYDKSITFAKEAINNNNTLWDDYAGAGKTYYINNVLLPQIGDDYVVLTPSHASLEDYERCGIKCEVIQKYQFSGEIPSARNIIIDEVGMVSLQGNTVIVKCALWGKNIYSFGDFKQLKPVNSEPCNNPIYLNYLYKTTTALGTNYRNHFTTEYYDKLREMADPEEIEAEIKKYNTANYYDAETVICYTNATKNKYNDMMLEKLNIAFGEEGCRVVCKSNDLREKGIFNNFYFTVKSNDGETITLSDGKQITLTQLEKYFEPGYCRTLYNIQGRSIKSFYYAMEDLRFIDGRGLYTLVSRLKDK